MAQGFTVVLVKLERWRVLHTELVACGLWREREQKKAPKSLLDFGLDFCTASPSRPNSYVFELNDQRWPSRRNKYLNSAFYF
jgi:hypothetical protein